MEKMRRIKLQNEINKIMMLDIFDNNRSPTIDSQSNDFHSINSDSSFSDITSSSRNVLSEINIQKEDHNSNLSNES